ncbi:MULTISPECIES: YqaJ viral recombinase family protein [unclassified Bradyrhizobium]|uniref:YqaJ viral recombinase family protein n=1 Tax=unclassified Bradyrhizobium TaxID=2631580 RepID=UPI002915F8CD|nr:MULTISPECIES: YqaJ viral recombinase family protein [unclassified Bradyrhizobium]
MTIERILVTSREQWLAVRSRDVTASVVAALRPGLHPYTSRLKLYKQHTGFEFPPAEGVRLERGMLLEYAVAERVRQERPDWTIEPAGVYLRDAELRLGATPDFFITDEFGRRGILQTKISIPSVFEHAWKDKVGEVVPPMWIRLQALTEAMLEDAEFGAIAVWIDHPFRNDVHILEFDRHPAAEAAVCADVARFWQDVHNRIEPEASGSVDSELIGLMYPEADPLVHVDLTGDNYLTSALAERERLKAEIKQAEARVEDIETDLRAKMKDAHVAHFNGFIARRTTFDVAGSWRQPYRVNRLTVTDLRQKEIDSAQPTRF